jgi:hypothetical protein
MASPPSPLASRAPSALPARGPVAAAPSPEGGGGSTCAPTPAAAAATALSPAPATTTRGVASPRMISSSRATAPGPIGTTTAPARSAPNTATPKASPLGSRTATRSPGVTPAARSRSASMPAAACRSAQVSVVPRVTSTSAGCSGPFAAARSTSAYTCVRPCGTRPSPSRGPSPGTALAPRDTTRQARPPVTADPTSVAETPRATSGRRCGPPVRVDPRAVGQPRRQHVPGRRTARHAVTDGHAAPPRRSPRVVSRSPDPPGGERRGASGGSVPDLCSAATTGSTHDRPDRHETSPKGVACSLLPALDGLTRGALSDSGHAGLHDPPDAPPAPRRRRLARRRRGAADSPHEDACGTTDPSSPDPALPARAATDDTPSAGRTDAPGPVARAR